MFKIEEFKANFLGGARMNRFEVEVPTLPDKAKFLFKGASLPGANIGEIIFNYMGTQAKFAGDKTFGDWELTMIIDEDFAGERELRAWNEMIRQNDSGLGASNHNQYKKDCFVTQYSVEGDIIAQYKLFGAWPKVLADAALSWDSTDSAMEMNITMSYDYYQRVA